MDNKVKSKIEYQEIFDELSEKESFRKYDKYFNNFVKLLNMEIARKEQYKWTLMYLIKFADLINDLMKQNEEYLKVINSILENFIVENTENKMINIKFKISYPKIFSNKIAKVKLDQIDDNNINNNNSNKNENRNNEKIEIKNSNKIINQDEPYNKNKKESNEMIIIKDLKDINIQERKESESNVILSNEIREKIQEKAVSNPSDKNKSKINKLKELILNKTVLDILSEPEVKESVCDIILHILPGNKAITDIKTKDKMFLVSIICKLFFIFTHKQKGILLSKMPELLNDVDVLSSDKIKNNLFHFKENIKKNSTFKKDYIKDLINNDEENIEENFIKIFNEINKENDVKDIYLIHVLNSNLKFLDNKVSKIILFFLYTSLSKENEFDTRTEYYYNFLLIKLFYKDIHFNEITISNDKQCVYNNSIDFSRLNSIASSFNSLFTIIFEKEEIEFCETVINNISKFYTFGTKYRRNDFLSNIEFTKKMILLTIIDKESIYYLSEKKEVNFRKNLEILIKLEENLFNNYNKFNKFNKNKIESIQSKLLYKAQYEAFIEMNGIIKSIQDKMESKLNATLYPFGSVTQLLGNSSSDLDLYLELTGDKVSAKKDFFVNLRNKLREIHGKNVDYVVSKRLITIKLTNKKEVKIDINYFGVCGVYNSTLLRLYSQCDARFPILAYNIKLLKAELEIQRNKNKNKEENKNDKRPDFINSFSWMLLLVTFLQDVVQPPLLPKLLENKRKSASLEVRNSNKNKKKEYHYKFPLESAFEIGHANFNILDDDIIEEFQTEYKLQIKEKNQMSLSELFIKFLEFFIFYFKNDAIYVNTTYGNERLVSKIELNAERQQEDMVFNHHLFNKKSCILIREPFDHTYNATQNLDEKNYRENMKILIEIYNNLVKTGDFKKQ